MNWLERFISTLLYGTPDFSIKVGDRVRSKYGTIGVEVVAINWALRAVAVKAVTEGYFDSVMIVPAANLSKV